MDESTSTAMHEDSLTSRRQWRRSAGGLMLAAGGLATRPRRATATTSPQTALWAEELTEAITDVLPQTTIPGAIVGVWQDGQPDYVQAFGVQDPDTGEAMTP